jgi:hypothetical protein
MATQFSVAQIKLEKEIEIPDYIDNYFTQLSDNETRLVGIDSKNGIVNIYNNDYSIFKKINIEAGFSDLGQISYNLFNLDNKIELLTLYNTSNGRQVRIYDENGSIIFEKSGFVFCGIVHFRGSPRRAYEKVL